jgi:hypothetical protein
VGRGVVGVGVGVDRRNHHARPMAGLPREAPTGNCPVATRSFIRTLLAVARGEDTPSEATARPAEIRYDATQWPSRFRARG